MPDRPRDGAPEPGTPEYDWLYGSRGQGAPPPPDATRALPQQPATPPPPPPGSGRGSTPPPGPSSRPAPPRPTPPPGAPPSGGGRRRLKPWLWVVVGLLLLWVVYLVAVPLFAWSKVEKIDAFPDDGRPDDQPGTTYLMVGSDSRGDLTAEQRKELHAGNAPGQRTDTIMILHTGSGPNLLMSIPRDSIVSIPGHGDAEKINAAYAYGGPKLLVRTVENETGIRIDHFVEIGFGGFVGLVDAVGGIEICPKEDMKDPLARLDIKKGCQEADGVTALGYARARHATQNGDLDRIAHQREVVSAIGHEAVSPWSIINPVRYWRLNMAAPDAVAVSEGTGPLQMAMWAMAMTRVNGDTGLTCSVPVRDFAVNWDEERSKQMFQAIIDDDTSSIGKDLCTSTGLPR
jgi:LCP family protein required for cell wall assembly